jgi:hypothetical protein
MSARLNPNPRPVLMDERDVDSLRAEIERLRAALREIVEHYDLSTETDARLMATIARNVLTAEK